MEKLYTVEEVADLASVTGRTIRNYLKNGRLVGRKIGGQWRFAEAEVTQLLNGGMPELAPPPVSRATTPDIPDTEDDAGSLLCYEEEETTPPPPQPAAPPEPVAAMPVSPPTQNTAETVQNAPAPVVSVQNSAFHAQPAPLPNPPAPIYNAPAMPPQYTQPTPAYAYAQQAPPQNVYQQTPATYPAAQQAMPAAQIQQPAPPPLQQTIPAATQPPLAVQQNVTPAATNPPVQNQQAPPTAEEEPAVAFSDVARRVTRFMAEIHELSQGPQMCTVIDMNQPLSAAKLASERLAAIADEDSAAEGLLCQAFVEYDDRFFVARYTLFGSTSFLQHCLQLIG